MLSDGKMSATLWMSQERGGLAGLVEEEPFGEDQDLVGFADVSAALNSNQSTWEYFEGFPDLYKRIRIGYIEEMRKQPVDFEKRLANFVKQTALNKMFGGPEATRV